MNLVVIFYQKICCNFYNIVKFVCTLPHGQSFVEKGASINKEHLVVNCQEGSLIVVCTVNDDMFSEQLDVNQYQHY